MPLLLLPAGAKAQFDFEITTNGMTVVGYNGKGGAVVIPSEGADIFGTLMPVTSIGYGAFYGQTNLTSVTIPATVTNIGGWVFGGCTNLGSVYFMGNCPTFGYSAFGGDNLDIPPDLLGLLFA